MLATPRPPSMHDLDAGIDAAVQRAAQRAREIAARTGTAVVYERDGKLVRGYPTLDEVCVTGVADLPRDGALLEEEGK